MLPKLENTGTNILQPGSPNTSARLPRLPRLNPSCQPIRSQYSAYIVQSEVSITRESSNKVSVLPCLDLGGTQGLGMPLTWSCYGAPGGCGNLAMIIFIGSMSNDCSVDTRMNNECLPSSEHRDILNIADTKNRNKIWNFP